MISEAVIETENVDELKQIIDSFLRKEHEYLSEIKILKEQIRCLRTSCLAVKVRKFPLIVNNFLF